MFGLQRRPENKDKALSLIERVGLGGKYKQPQIMLLQGEKMKPITEV